MTNRFLDPKRGVWYRFLLDGAVESKIPKGLEYPGTYVIANLGTPLYVGQSGNIKRRLRAHIRQSHFQHRWLTPWGSFMELLIAVRRERFGFERLAVEKRLIVKFNPPFNNLLNTSFLKQKEGP